MRTGILQRAADAKERTDKEDIIEQAKLDIMGVQAGAEESLTKGQLKSILEPKYGTLSGEGENQILTTAKGQEIRVSEIYNGSFAVEPIANIVQVGDYIKYGEKLTAKTYPTDTNETGYSTSQTFATNTSMLWRVMNKKANGDVEIVAVSNVLANDGTTGLYLNGEKGFVNAETVLKNLCDELYTSSYGEGRSINVGDINSLTGYTPATPSSQTYTSEKFWDKENNIFKTATTANPVTVESDYYDYTVATTMPLYDTLIKGTTNGSGGTGTNYPNYYWLGSRCAYADSSGAGFYVRAVSSGRVSYSTLVFAYASGGFYEPEPAFGVRPVVTLKSNIQIEEATATEGVATWTIK